MMSYHDGATALVESLVERRLCPKCHSDFCALIEVYEREIVDGEVVEIPVKAWDCGDCGELTPIEVAT